MPEPVSEVMFSHEERGYVFRVRATVQGGIAGPAVAQTNGMNGVLSRHLAPALQNAINEIFPATAATEQGEEQGIITSRSS